MSAGPTALAGARVVTPEGVLDDGWVRIADGVIAEIGRGEIGRGGAPGSALDLGGGWLVPGFVDLHVHMREPGNEAAETIETGSRAAVKGGFTAVVAMPNTDPCMDDPAVIRQVIDLGARSLCTVKPSAAISLGRAGEQLAPMGELAALGEVLKNYPVFIWGFDGIVDVLHSGR